MAVRLLPPGPCLANRCLWILDIQMQSVIRGLFSEFVVT